MDIFCDIWNWLKSEKEQLTVMFSAITVILIYIGLNNWQKQLNGTNRIKLSKSLLKQVFIIRDLINYARLRVNFEYEYPTDKGLSESEKIKHIHLNRLKPITTALQKFENEYYDVLIEWGDLRLDYLTRLKSLYFRLLNATETYIENYDDFISKKYPEHLEIRRILFQFDNEDKYSIELNELVADIENWLRPKFQGIIRRKRLKMNK